MRLILNKGQKKSMIGNTPIFQLSARAELTPDEKAALDKYRFGGETVYYKDNVKPGAGTLTKTLFDMNITVNTLVRGKTVECKSITEIIEAENAMMEGCRVLKGLLETCRAFGGETIHEF